jgi:hypothetical protein
MSSTIRRKFLLLAAWVTVFTAVNVGVAVRLSAGEEGCVTPPNGCHDIADCGGGNCACEITIGVGRCDDSK